MDSVIDTSIIQVDGWVIEILTKIKVTVIGYNSGTVNGYLTRVAD